MTVRSIDSRSCDINSDSGSYVSKPGGGQPAVRSCACATQAGTGGISAISAAARAALTTRQYWEELKRDIKPIYTAVNATAARTAFDELADKWGQRYPAVIRLWDNAWAEFIPFLDYDVEIRRVICSTNAIESLNARYRRAIKARGHFPHEQAALKCLYLVTRSLDPTGVGRARWTMRWKPALNAFAITFADRFPAAETY